MNRKDAESLTGLSSREFPDGATDYLRCQLGRKESVLVQTSAFRTVPQIIFHLIAFGATWDKAVENWEKLQDKAGKSVFAL